MEKLFGELKSKLVKKKARGSSATAKSTQAVFLCLAHNLLVLLEENLKVERIDNAAKRKHKDGRNEQAEKNGANYVAIALQRFTVGTLKFIRWLRNFVYRATSWGGGSGQVTPRLCDLLAVSFLHR